MVQDNLQKRLVYTIGALFGIVTMIVIGLNQLYTRTSPHPNTTVADIVWNGPVPVFWYENHSDHNGGPEQKVIRATGEVISTDTSILHAGPTRPVLVATDENSQQPFLHLLTTDDLVPIILPDPTIRKVNDLSFSSDDRYLAVLSEHALYLQDRSTDQWSENLLVQLASSSDPEEVIYEIGWETDTQDLLFITKREIREHNRTKTKLLARYEYDASTQQFTSYPLTTHVPQLKQDEDYSSQCTPVVSGAAWSFISPYSHGVHTCEPYIGPAHMEVIITNPLIGHQKIIVRDTITGHSRTVLEWFSTFNQYVVRAQLLNDNKMLVIIDHTVHILDMNTGAYATLLDLAFLSHDPTFPLYDFYLVPTFTNSDVPDHASDEAPEQDS